MRKRWPVEQYKGSARFADVGSGAVFLHARLAARADQERHRPWGSLVAPGVSTTAVLTSPKGRAAARPVAQSAIAPSPPQLGATVAHPRPTPSAKCVIQGPRTSHGPCTAYQVQIHPGPTPYPVSDVWRRR